MDSPTSSSSPSGDLGSDRSVYDNLSEIRRSNQRKYLKYLVESGHDEYEKDLDEYMVPLAVSRLYNNKFEPSDKYGLEEDLLLIEVTEAKQGSQLTSDNYKPRLELLNQIEDEHVNYLFRDCSILGPKLTSRQDLV